MQEQIDYDVLSEALARIGYHDGEASEYHGTLCGALCVHKPEDIDLAHLIDSGDRPPAGSDAKTTALLQALRTQTFDALEDEGMSFELLLPDDDTALVPRVRALVAWCEGFLYGLSSRPGLDLSRCSDDAREIVHDMTQLTQAAVGEEDDPNVEETAYAELVEYLRVGAQLVFMELHPKPTLDPSASQTLH
ncbi:UPF0149 family protein [Sinimarinibacterium sp. CAU 1509]|uniref:UPF0149 family protein n=1 Tax=Sinimarinibacterium sp. CAU 1509 TaxID=2562283 RepID=UPI0010AC5A5E|nr:UPF0149 family protein [Sinimarinibacterium sp. CAU 1509]TJY61062.1 UPF0149 family protein [Sinimarinibacterium sp. CAU 1509]